MKSKLFTICLLFTILVAPDGVANSRARGRMANPVRAQENARTMRVAPNVLISLCVDAGDVTVTSWERDEVEARATGGEVELRAGGDDLSAASSVEVVVRGAGDNSASSRRRCAETASVEVRAPRGASIEIISRGGDVRVSNIAEARVDTVSGDVEIRGVTRGTEAKTVSGAIRIEDARGRTVARTITGNINIVSAGFASANDALEAQSVNGQILLDRVAYSSVSATAVLSDVEMTGALVAGANYNLQSSSGNITVNLPADASFRINARVPGAGTIITDFPIRYDEETAPSVARRLTGAHGAGASNLNLTSNSGTVHLRRR